MPLRRLWRCHNGQSHCEKSPGSFDECRESAASRYQPSAKPTDLDCEPADRLLPSTSPSPFIIITQTRLILTLSSTEDGKLSSTRLFLTGDTYRNMEQLMSVYDAGGDAENARHENARNAIVWNTACCICLSSAEQECMSRQERAPDFAANCVLVND